MQRDKLFFIAILPTNKTQEAVNVLKQDAARLFDSKKALTSPPHITLIPPFKWKEEEIAILEQNLVSFAENQKYFDLELNGFGAFEPRVIFIDVVKNNALNELQKDLENHLEDKINLTYDRPKRTYHPHMTIAFKDLKPNVFPEAFAYFSKINFKQKITVDRMVLLEYANKRWNVNQEFLF